MRLNPVPVSVSGRLHSEAWLQRAVATSMQAEAIALGVELLQPAPTARQAPRNRAIFISTFATIVMGRHVQGAATVESNDRDHTAIAFARSIAIDSMTHGGGRRARSAVEDPPAVGAGFLRLRHPV